MEGELQPSYHSWREQETNFNTYYLLQPHACSMRFSLSQGKIDFEITFSYSYTLRACVLRAYAVIRQRSLYRYVHG